MAGPTSITEIDLAPIPGKTYWNTVREWHEDSIYFLLVDRFHDDRHRAPVPTGTIPGIIRTIITMTCASPLGAGGWTIDHSLKNSAIPITIIAGGKFGAGIHIRSTRMEIFSP